MSYWLEQSMAYWLSFLGSPPQKGFAFFTGLGVTLSSGIMFIKNKHNHYYELFQPVKTYKGEPPTLAGKDLLSSVLAVCFETIIFQEKILHFFFSTSAGFLIYPDTPIKMETTSHKAFSFRPVPQQDGGKGQLSSSPKSKPVSPNCVAESLGAE